MIHHLQNPRRVLSVAMLSCALIAGGCTSDSDGDATSEPAIAPDAAEANFDSFTSVGQVTVSGADADAEISLVSDDEAVQTARTDDQGALIFRDVEPGRYRVATPAGDDQQATGELTVPTEEESLPEAEFYQGQTLEPGYTYIETRDGTQLAASVYLPDPRRTGHIRRWWSTRGTTRQGPAPTFSRTTRTSSPSSG
ncbi:MAG: hypothetical protein M5U19_15280 [Microthrixaceae bacterium]|nr:hypothetical protein [Microthrixaceae bacterium]